MDQLVIFVMGVVVAIFGYLLKRWWEGQSIRDAINETLQLASLHKDLRSGDISLDALGQLKSDLRERATFQLKGQDEVLTGMGRAIREEAEGRPSEYEPQTQAEMSQYAFHLASLAEQELKFVVEQLADHLSSSEAKAFRMAQKAWEFYADAQADFESLEAEGGSMQGMLRSAARRTLIVERAGFIKGEVNKRNQIGE
jgi:uncharacterized protein YecT (DUF1311 family)